MQSTKYVGRQSKQGQFCAQFEVTCGPTASVFSWTADMLSANIETMKQNQKPLEYVKIFEEALEDLVGPS